MSKNYKVLIAYDSSEFADQAIEDLRFAGLPENGVEVLIVIVAKIWLPPNKDEEKEFLTEGLRKKYEKNMEILEDAKEIVGKAAEKVKGIFPDWKVETHATYGSPAWEILSQAGKFKSDLIVVGSQGLSALQRIWLGSVSQKIVAEADCSVRVARRNEENDANEPRIILGFDGTDGAEKAVEEILNRNWKADTKIRVVIAQDYELNREEFSHEGRTSEIKERGEEIVKELQKKGFDASLKFVEEDPKDLMLQEAEELKANCIYVGATKFSSKMERFWIGSVSSAIATRATCSVEVVRPNYYEDE